MSGGVYGLLGLLSTGLYLLIALALVVVGLTHVRRVQAMAGFCLAGAGAVVGFGAVARQVSSFAFSLGGSSVFVVVQVLTLLTSLLSGVLAAAAIFLLAGALKQGSRPTY
jgi:hypothetical protein